MYVPEPHAGSRANPPIMHACALRPYESGNRKPNAWRLARLAMAQGVAAGVLEPK
jgi:hypothetical protein